MNSIQDAIWVANSLFNRNKVSGSSANMSIKIDGDLLITRSGSCFGNLSKNDFCNIELEEKQIKPSKELPLHEYLYENNSDIKAIIHTHSTYSTLASCLYKATEEEYIEIDSPTPYLKIKVGKVGWVDYAEPGSEELFLKFKNSLKKGCDTYLLKNHGVIIGAENIMEAFYKLEEFEEACKNSFLIREYKGEN